MLSGFPEPATSSTPSASPTRFPAAPTSTATRPFLSVSLRAVHATSQCPPKPTRGPVTGTASASSASGRTGALARGPGNGGDSALARDFPGAGAAGSEPEGSGATRRAPASGAGRADDSPPQASANTKKSKLGRGKSARSLSHLAAASARVRGVVLVDPRSLVLPLAVLAAAPLVGCGEPPTVLLDASLTSPSLTVEATALTTEVDGSFGMELELGELAPDPTTVKLGTFSLERDGEVLLNPLALETNPTFPLDVGVGKSKHVDVTIANPEGDPELAVVLCAAELQIVGTLTDSLGDDRPQTLRSVPFRADCP